MMKKSLFAFMLFFASVALFAQNIQLHFDGRRILHHPEFPRNYLTATFEMFKADKWGSTFMFADFDFNAEKGSVGLAYTEIARTQKLGEDLPIAAHIEFNGGVATFGTIPSAYLLGSSYATKIGNVNINTYLAYKHHAFQKTSHDVQWTAVWDLDVKYGKYTVRGFLDVWTENKHRMANTAGGKKMILLTEPQFWYNVNDNIAFGSEIEISYNFYNSLLTAKSYINPTIAAKWKF